MRPTEFLALTATWVLARPGGQKTIPIWIFPCRLSDSGYRAVAEKHPRDPGLIAFWENLKEGFDLFEKERRLPVISVSVDGRYRFKQRHSGER